LADEARSGFAFSDQDEDVHSAVERRLAEKVGEVAGKLHTGRSRNDQVALDVMLYLRDAAHGRAADLAGFASALADRATDQAETLIPSYTHLQQAQVVSLGHHLLAYAWMALRDRERFLGLAERAARSPLGAGASAGSSLPIDPTISAALLGFVAPFANSLDAVASRDLVAEFVFCAAQAMVNVSRLAEEMIRWATNEFGWVTYSDATTTGSSALPHKKNPDIAELARGRSAAVIGDLMTVLTMQKGLPLAYNRDLQEDKPPLFRADDTLAATLPAVASLLEGADFHPPPPSEWTSALDLAEVLVGRGVPFRLAHTAVGKLVSDLVASERTLTEATAAELVGAHPAFVAADLAMIGPAVSVGRRRTPASGTPQSVRDQVGEIRRLLQASPPG
jgi:argininosuccinate lyase